MIAANLITLAVAAAGAIAAPLQKRAYGGQATYYAAGLGACGWTNSGSDFIVALNAPMWGGSSGQASSHCGQQLTITNDQNGNTQVATVADLCPGCGYGSLDMSTGLFAALNNGNMDAGVFPISWSWGANSGSSNNDAPKPSPKPTPKETRTYSASAATPTSRKASATRTPTSSSAAPQPEATGSVDTVVATPERWSSVENQCGINTDPKTIGVAIGPSALLSRDDLWKACGKWIQVENNANGKSLSVQVVSYIPEADSLFALADGYTLLANNYGDYVQPIEAVTWGFIDGQGM